MYGGTVPPVLRPLIATGAVLPTTRLGRHLRGPCECPERLPRSKPFDQRVRAYPPACVHGGPCALPDAPIFRQSKQRRKRVSQGALVLQKTPEQRFPGRLLA